MKYTYIPRGICPTKITIDLADGIVRKIEFRGGCNGNLSTISKLLEGMPAEEVIKKLSGIRCGMKSTSCADQLTRGIRLALQEQNSSDEKAAL